MQRAKEEAGGQNCMNVITEEDGSKERKMDRCKPRAPRCYEKGPWKFVEI